MSNFTQPRELNSLCPSLRYERSRYGTKKKSILTDYSPGKSSGDCQTIGLFPIGSERSFLLPLPNSFVQNVKGR